MELRVDIVRDRDVARAAEGSRWCRATARVRLHRPVRGGRKRRSPVASRARGAFALRRAGRRPENLPRPETAGGTRYRAVHVDAKGAPAAGSASGSAGSCFGRSAAGRWGPAGNSPRLQALDRRVGCLPRVGVWARSLGRWYLWGRCLPRAGVWDAQCASVGRTG